MATTAPQASQALLDAFPNMRASLISYVCGTSRKNKKKKARVKKLKINLPAAKKLDGAVSIAPAVGADTDVWTREDASWSRDGIRKISVEQPDLGESEDSFGNKTDPLDFYQLTHEEQDPAYIAFTRLKQQQRRDAELANLDADEIKAKLALQELLRNKWCDQDCAFRRQVQKLRSDMRTKQDMQKQRLLSQYKKQIECDQGKVAEGTKWLENKQQEDINKAMILHQQHAVQLGAQGGPGGGQSQAQERAAHAWASISQRLQIKHNDERNQFRSKEADLKKKCEDDYCSQTDNLKQRHLKRQKEMDSVIQKLEARFRQQQEQQRQHHLRRHDERMRRQRESILSKFSGAVLLANEQGNDAKDKNTSKDEDKAKSADIKVDDDSSHISDSHVSVNFPNKSKKMNERDGRFTSIVDGETPSDAVLRLKRRKTAMSGAPIQLVVEIHNEGVFVLAHGGVRDHGSGQPQLSAHMSALGGAEKKSDKSVENKKGGQLASDTIGTDSAAVQKDSEDLGIGGRADPPNKGDGGNKLSLVGHRTSDFIPWGVRARKILHSIVCGEVPAGYDVGGSGYLRICQH